MLLPIISLYAFAGYVYYQHFTSLSFFTRITFIDPSLEELYSEFKNLKFLKTNDSKDKFFQQNQSL